MEFLLENHNRMAAVLVDMLGAIVEYRNQESGEHIRRNKDYTRILAEEFMKEFPEKT